MGMYDDIVISKSYMRNLLTKKQEKILNTCKSNDYQTKSLDNCMLKYSFYRSKLYKADYNWEKKSFEKRKPVKFTGTINAYRTIKIRDDTYWIEVNFTVKDGVLDTKDLVKFELEEDRDDYSSNIQDVIVDEFHKKLKTRFYSWLRRKVQSLYYILIDKTTYKPKKD